MREGNHLEPKVNYLRLEEITKRFGRFVANDRISLQVKAGEIHGVLGENGAGKTTLMNILSGRYRPDAGQIYLQGQPVQIISPSVAIAHGIGMIHQHFMLVPQLSVTENIILGTSLTLRLNLQKKAKEIAAMSEAYGLPINPLALVGDLPITTQQRVEILKALYRQAKLLILDEPTAVLTPPEIQAFFTVLRQLAASNHTILFISHKLDEVLNLCNAVTVLRRGQVVATMSTQNATREDLARLMVGRAVMFDLKKPARSLGSTVLEIRNLQVLHDDRRLKAIQNLSLQVQAGEIVGIAGVDGNGSARIGLGNRGSVSGGGGANLARWTRYHSLDTATAC